MRGLACRPDPPTHRSAPCRPGPDGAMQRKRLPMGALRASLGQMSRFEDVVALLAFLADTFVDASAASIRTAPEDEVALQLPGASPALEAAVSRHLASC